MDSKKQSFVLLSALLFLNIFIFSSADDQYYEFILQESQITKLCSTKTILTVNGSFPGPDIRVRKGDTVFVNVRNQGNYSVSMQWEGIKDSIDGSDTSIQPGRNFTYEIELDDEIGTLWWHARSAWASATVHGAFVILPAEDEKYPFPDPSSDITIILGPWFKQQLDESTPLGQPDAYTIDGHPGDTYGCSNDTKYETQVDYQAIYLLRLVNAVANETMVFEIAYHSFTIVGRNGAYVTRSFADSLTLAPGQTLDVIFCPDQNLGRYNMTARSSTGTHVTNGLVRYSGT